MTTRSFAEVRQDVAARVEAIGGGWSEAPIVAQTFGPEAAANAISGPRGHLAFAVDITRSEALQQRQRAADGLLVRSTVVIRWLARLARDEVDALDAALAAEVALISQLLTFDATWPATFHLRYDRSERGAFATGEWLDNRTTFTADHRVALT
jgi:hypothetical protein